MIISPSFAADAADSFAKGYASGDDFGIILGVPLFITVIAMLWEKNRTASVTIRIFAIALIATLILAVPQIIITRHKSEGIEERQAWLNKTLEEKKDAVHKEIYDSCIKTTNSEAGAPTFQMQYSCTCVADALTTYSNINAISKVISDLTIDVASMQARETAITLQAIQQSESAIEACKIEMKR